MLDATRDTVLEALQSKPEVVMTGNPLFVGPFKTDQRIRWLGAHSGKRTGNPPATASARVYLGGFAPPQWEGSDQNFDSYDLVSPVKEFILPAGATASFLVMGENARATVTRMAAYAVALKV